MRCWVFSLVSSASPDRCHRRAQIWPQMLTNLWCAQHSALLGSSFPFLPNHRCRLYPHTLHYHADHTWRVDSFVSSVWDRSTVQTNLQLPICTCQVCCVQFLTIHPATYTLERRLVALRNQFVAGVPTGRSLARRPPAAAGMAARPGDNLRLSPALLASTCRLPPDRRTRTPQGHKTPLVGVQSQGTHTTVHTHRPDSMQAREFWRERTTMIPGGYNIKSPCGCN